jgi:hypothetical protein
MSTGPELLLRARKDCLFFLRRRWKRRLQPGHWGPSRVEQGKENLDAVNGEPKAIPSDLLWGVAAIGKAINRNPRQAFHLLSTGAITCAKKKGGHWVASRAALLRELGA